MARCYGNQNYGVPVSRKPIPVLEMMFNTVPASSNDLRQFGYIS
ncbi:hypothetical protein SNOG_06395 [Parastagonospora nodorum SN15]|uniref:Uncharacterized protein n=1 Tax=Phaeosphaeria nodorum (strain SN15 / ATCC MYA-4574 / FGSC 10173) TaxID=321614 RepID=Q0UPB9_PHANO|nr:hypothetical protein SNOG_06395 [Parastagonospora nodorum SN15]EAT86226.1 hypothetical protein SNOG_06395 [Parastagonospora nodorum SN15]